MRAAHLIPIAGFLLLHIASVNAQIFQLASNPSITYKLEDDCIVSIQDMTGEQTKEACDARGLGCCIDDTGDINPPCKWINSPIRMCRDSCVGQVVCQLNQRQGDTPFDVGPGSCRGDSTCQDGSEKIGANACNGFIACANSIGSQIGNGSCNGFVVCAPFKGTTGDCVTTCSGNNDCPSEGFYDTATGMCGPFPPTSSPSSAPSEMPSSSPKMEPVGMIGDPHVKTWGGTWFDFMGECDLVLLSAPNFDGLGHNLDIQVRTTIRYDYSFIESAAIQIGDDVLEVSSFGDYAVNGVDAPYLGGRAGRLRKYNIYHTMEDKKRHKFDIVIGPNENITISSFKDLVAVSINAGAAASAKYFGNSVGIMGSYDGKLVARDGVTAMNDMNAFGQEWQVTDKEPMLFRNERKPQYPSKCNLPSAKTASQRRLGERIAKRTAKVACSFLSGESFANCVLDVMAIGDLDVAKSYA